MNHLNNCQADAEEDKGKLARVAGFFVKWRPLIGLSLQVLVLTAMCAFPGLAQNPWGGSGTTKLANTGSNLLVVLTWASFLIGIIAIVSIGICIYFEMNYKKNIAVAVIGLGGFGIMGSIAYDLVNLSSITMGNPTMGN